MQKPHWEQELETNHLLAHHNGSSAPRPSFTPSGVSRLIVLPRITKEECSTRRANLYWIMLWDTQRICKNASCKLVSFVMHLQHIYEGVYNRMVDIAINSRLHLLSECSQQPQSSRFSFSFVFQLQIPPVFVPLSLILAASPAELQFLSQEKTTDKTCHPG